MFPKRLSPPSPTLFSHDTHILYNDLSFDRSSLHLFIVATYYNSFLFFPQLVFTTLSFLFTICVYIYLVCILFIYYMLIYLPGFVFFFLFFFTNNRPNQCAFSDWFVNKLTTRVYFCHCTKKKKNTTTRRYSRYGMSRYVCNTYIHMYVHIYTHTYTNIYVRICKERD